MAMSTATSLIGQVLALQGLAAYALVASLAFGEAALFVGFVLPGETAVLLGGVLAQQHRVSLATMIVTATIAAIAGDSVGYEVGRRFGSRLLTASVFDRHRSSLERGQATLRLRGGRAVFLGRFTAFLRAVMPGLAGLSRMPYGRFLVFNAAGGALWASTFTLLGYLAGTSYDRVERTAGRASLILLFSLVALIAVAGLGRRRRTQAPRQPARTVIEKDKRPHHPGRSPLPPRGMRDHPSNSHAEPSE